MILISTRPFKCHLDKGWVTANRQNVVDRQKLDGIGKETDLLKEFFDRTVLFRNTGSVPYFEGTWFPLLNKKRELRSSLFFDFR